MSGVTPSPGAEDRPPTRLILRTPPALYRRQIRLRAAHRRVLNGNRSILQIAHECGFTDSSHLIRWFKRAYQVSPARLRGVHGELGIHWRARHHLFAFRARFG